MGPNVHLMAANFMAHKTRPNITYTHKHTYIWNAIDA